MHKSIFLSTARLFPKRNLSTMYVSRKTPKTLYIRKDRHSGISMALSESSESRQSTQILDDFENRDGEVTTVIRYPSGSPSSEIRYSITVVEIHEDRLNDSRQAEWQPTTWNPPSRTEPNVQRIKQFLVGRVEKQRGRFFSGNSPGVEENISGCPSCRKLTEADWTTEATVAEEDKE